MGRWCGLKPVFSAATVLSLEADDLEMKLNIEVCFSPFKGIVFNLTSFVQYNRPCLPVLFWRVVFRDRTGGQQNQTWLCLIWFYINILYMCKKRSESFDIK